MDQEKPQAILFDWDDTIVENWPMVFESVNAVRAHMGVPAWTMDEARRFIGPSSRDLFTSLFGEAHWQEADRFFYETFSRLSKSRGVKLLPGAADTLSFLAGQEGICLAVVSNKRGALLREEAEKTGLDRFFSALVGAGDTAFDKPHPGIVTQALKLSGATAISMDKVWLVGDSRVDIACARAAGCRAILLESKLPPAEVLQQNPPDLRVKDHFKLMEYLKGCFA